MDLQRLDNQARAALSLREALIVLYEATLDAADLHPSVFRARHVVKLRIDALEAQWSKRLKPGPRHLPSRKFLDRAWVQFLTRPLPDAPVKPKLEQSV